MKRLLTAALVAVFVAAAAQAGEPNARPVKVPFELIKTQHMTVMVKVNGKGPFRLIFDTGAPVTLINNKVAREAGLIKKDKKGTVMPLFPGMGQYKLKTLQLGDLTAKDVPVLVMDHPTVSLVSKHVGPIEGIVGFSFFARYRMTIDYQTKEMTFVPVKFQPPDVMQKMFAMILANKKDERKVVGPAGVWGFSVEKKQDDAEPGVTVKAVVPGSPAAKAGLQMGDRLLTLDDRWTDTVVDCYRAAAHVRPGTAARLLVKRDGKEMNLTVTVQSGL
jgi:hypothetical protein